jgi:hypothetical protein
MLIVFAAAVYTVSAAYAMSNITKGNVSKAIPNLNNSTHNTSKAIYNNIRV